MHAVIEFDPGAELNGIGRDREVAFGTDVRISLEQNDADARQLRKVIGGGVYAGLNPPAVSSRLASSSQ